MMGLSFFFFFFGFCSRWLFKVVVVGSIWGGFVVRWLWVTKWRLKFLNLGFIDVGLVGSLLPVVVVGFCGQRWLLGLVASDGGSGFQYGMDLQWRWFWVLKW